MSQSAEHTDRCPGSTAKSLPSQAATLTGGCTCGAIRYRIAVPAAEERTPSPFAPPEMGFRLPVSMVCHCNDCRHHTGSVLPVVYFQVHAPALTVSVLAPSGHPSSNLVTGRFLDVQSEGYDQAASDASRPAYKPSKDVLCALAGKTAEPSYLRFFHSTDTGVNYSRSFCSNCGTGIGSHLKLQADWLYESKLPDGYEDLFDVFAGSLDRKWLDEGWVVPEDEINWKHGIELGKTVSATAHGLKGLVKWKITGPGEGQAEDQELERLAGKA